MKKHLLFLIFIVSSLGAMAQAFDWTELRSDSSTLKANGAIRSICTDAAGRFTNASANIG